MSLTHLAPPPLKGTYIQPHLLPMNSIKDKGHKNKEKDPQANLQVVTILVAMERKVFQSWQLDLWKSLPTERPK